MSQSRFKPKRSDKRVHYGWRVVWPLWAVAALFLAVALACIFQAYRIYGPRKSDVRTIHLKSQGYLRMPLAMLLPMQMHLYAVKVKGQEVRFLVERTQDRVVHVALAKCSACLRSGKRNYAKNGKMICGRCNGPMPFAPKDRKVKENTCFLRGIRYSEVDGELIVAIHDVIEGDMRMSREHVPRAGPR